MKLRVLRYLLCASLLFVMPAAQALAMPPTRDAGASDHARQAKSNLPTGRLTPVAPAGAVAPQALTPTATPTHTYTPTSTPTNTPTSTPSNTPTNTPTNT